MSFIDIKTLTRRVVHNALAIPCQYLGPDLGDTPVQLTARLHDKITVGGQAGGQQGYATIIEGVTRAVFNRETLLAAGITLKKRGTVTFFNYNGTGLDAVVKLDSRDSFEGPVTEKWTVALVSMA